MSFLRCSYRQQCPQYTTDQPLLGQGIPAIPSKSVINQPLVINHPRLAKPNPSPDSPFQIPALLGDFIYRPRQIHKQLTCHSILIPRPPAPIHPPTTALLVPPPSHKRIKPPRPTYEFGAPGLIPQHRRNRGRRTKPSQCHPGLVVVVLRMKVQDGLMVVELDQVREMGVAVGEAHIVY